MIILTIFMIMAALIVIDSNQRDLQSTRANELQSSLDNLRARTDQDAKFFEIVRELMITTDPTQRQALIGKLKAFKFDTSTSTSTTTVPKSNASSAPTFQPSSPTTGPKPRPPPTTTSTTTPKKPPSTTTTTSPLACVILPQTHTSICT